MDLKRIWKRIWLKKTVQPKEFELVRMHRFYFHYIEGDHTMKVVIEGEIYLNRNSRWLPPHDKEPIDREKFQVIKDRVAQALVAQGIDPVFV